MKSRKLKKRKNWRETPEGFYVLKKGTTNIGDIFIDLRKPFDKWHVVNEHSEVVCFTPWLWESEYKICRKKKSFGEKILDILLTDI